MIAKDKALKQICKLYHLVENYIEARFDKENKWQLHHRREIDEHKTRQELIDEGRYYDVEAEELIFLRIDEHARLHMKGSKLPESTKKKISEGCKKVFNDHPEKIARRYGKDNIFSNKEFIEKNSAKKKKKVLCIETQIIYDSLGDAARDMNINFKSISLVCRGKLKSAGGKSGNKIKYTFKFI